MLSLHCSFFVFFNLFYSTFGQQSWDFLCLDNTLFCCKNLNSKCCNFINFGRFHQDLILSSWLFNKQYVFYLLIELVHIFLEFHIPGRYLLKFKQNSITFDVLSFQSTDIFLFEYCLCHFSHIFLLWFFMPSKFMLSNVLFVVHCNLLSLSILKQIFFNHYLFSLHAISLFCLISCVCSFRIVSPFFADNISFLCSRLFSY